MEDHNNRHDQGEDIFSKVVRAGKRTYFFDVRSTRNNDLYVTICESKKVFVGGSERPIYDKRKIHLYKEDFEKFSEALNEALSHIKTNYPEIFNNENRYNHRDEPEKDGGDFHANL